jgi:hypothetical protein
MVAALVKWNIMPSSIITDLKKAYCSFKRQEIWKVLHRANVSKGLMKRKKNIYDKCENSVLTGQDSNCGFLGYDAM